MITVLITKDSKGDFRYKILTCTLQDTGFYLIERFSGKIGGKQVKQPPLLIKAGKVKRSIKEQAELEFNSLITKDLSKGYKDLKEFTTKTLNELTSEELSSFFGEHKTDMAGIRKPMLATETSNAKPALWNRYWRISKKLDGKMDAVVKFR